jgi:hypothetical protein
MNLEEFFLLKLRFAITLLNLYLIYAIWGIVR